MKTQKLLSTAVSAVTWALPFVLSTTSLQAQVDSAYELVNETDASSDAIKDTYWFRVHRSGANGAAGLGGRAAYQAENAAGTMHDAAELTFEWLDATDTSEDVQLVMGVMNVGSMEDRIRLRNDGVLLHAAGSAISSGTFANGELQIWIDAATDTARIRGKDSAGDVFDVTLATFTTPCGADTEIQYNDGGSCGASEDFTYSGAGIDLAGDASVDIDLKTFSNTAAIAPELFFWKARGTGAAPAALDSGDTVAQIGFVGYDTGATVGGSIFAKAAAEHGTGGDSTDVPIDLEVWLAPDGSATQAMVATFKSDKEVALEGALSVAGAITAGSGNVQITEADGDLDPEALDVANLTEDSGIASGDFLLYSDTGDSGNMKKVDVDDLPGGGAWVLLSSASISNDTTIDFDGLLDGSTYAMHVLVFSGVSLDSAGSNETLWLRTDTDGGASYDSGASDYMWVLRNIDANADTNNANDLSDSEIEIFRNLDNTATRINGMVWLSPNSRGHTVWALSARGEGNDTAFARGSGSFGSGFAVPDSVQVGTSAADFKNGSIFLYGISE